MALLPIVLYPDPVLLEPTGKVEEIDDNIRELVKDMTETMYAADGIGLAANQVGVPLRFFIADLSQWEEKDPLRVFINPEITNAHGKQVGEEGCLSFPGISLEIERDEQVTVEALDLEGKPFSMTAEGLLARAIQHECEHLDGKVFIRNVSALKRELLKKQIKKRIKNGDWRGAVT
jgi:peptide deformylase